MLNGRFSRWSNEARPHWTSPDPRVSILRLVVPISLKDDGADVTVEPHIDASPAVDPAGLKFGDRVVGDPVDKYLEQQKLVYPSYGLGGLRLQPSDPYCCGCA